MKRGRDLQAGLKVQLCGSLAPGGTCRGSHHVSLVEHGRWDGHSDLFQALKLNIFPRYSDLFMDENIFFFFLVFSDTDLSEFLLNKQCQEGKGVHPAPGIESWWSQLRLHGWDNDGGGRGDGGGIGDGAGGDVGGSGDGDGGDGGSGGS